MKNLFLVVVAAAGILLAVDSCHQRQDNRAWEARADAAVAMASEEAARASLELARADAASAEAERLQGVADSLGRRTRERVVEVREVVVPEYAVPFVAPRDSIIEDLMVENEILEGANLALRASNSYLRLALGRVTASESALRAVLDDRPRPTSRWLPSVGFGAFAGACSDGRACSGLGVTVGWEIPIR